MKKYLLPIVVFISGIAIMTFEVVGSRVLAPFVGTSIMVWSSLIGVMLLALALGYWWGGKVADSNPNLKFFSSIIFFAAIFIGLTAFLKLPILNFIDKNMKDLRLESFLASFLLFAPGSFFLAAISPYAVKLKLINIKESGSTVGNLSAISTVGSILGTFLTGFVLVLYFGNTKIILMLSVLLLLLSLFVYIEALRKIKIGILAVLVLISFFGADRLDAFFLPAGVIQVNSQYSDIMIAKDTDNFSDINTNSGTGRPILKIYTGPGTVQSGMFTDNDNSLVFPYTKFFHTLSTFFEPNIKSALAVGGGAYSFPKDLLKNYPESTVDVVEIDPMMTEVAKKYFNLPETSRLTSYNEDGRVFLNKNTKKYDAIYMDSFRTFVPPYQLATKEAVEKIYQSLNDNGVVMVNILSALTGDKSKFFQAEYQTYKEFFPNLYVFRVQVPFSDVSQNLILVASKSSTPITLVSKDKDIQSYLDHSWGEPVADDIPILTDDHAPVAEYMLADSTSIK